MNPFRVRVLVGLRSWVFMAFAFVVSGVTLSAQAEGTAWTGWVSWVSDGDTLVVLPDHAHEPVKLRIEGMDAPETCQPGGEASRDAMIALVYRKTVQVYAHGTDTYGRVLGRVEMDGRDVAAEMVSSGMAWAYRFRETSGPYAVLERQARKQKRGLFAEPQPMTPRVFRQFHGSCHTPAP